MFGLRDRGGGHEGKNNFVYLKWASHLWLSHSKFHVGSARSPPPPLWIRTSLAGRPVGSVVAAGCQFYPCPDGNLLVIFMARCRAALARALFRCFPRAPHLQPWPCDETAS